MVNIQSATEKKFGRNDLFLTSSANNLKSVLRDLLILVGCMSPMRLQLFGLSAVPFACRIVPFPTSLLHWCCSQSDTACPVSQSTHRHKFCQVFSQTSLTLLALAVSKLGTYG